MTKPHTKVMALATASGKVGHVILRDGKLLDWKVSKVAARSPERMQRVLQGWLDIHQPDLVVTEAINPYCRKSKRTLSIMSAAEGVIATFGCNHTAVLRERHFPNKYLEIDALAQTYPALAPWAPAPRKCYEPEELNTILFEALALVDQAER